MISRVYSVQKVQLSFTFSEVDSIPYLVVFAGGTVNSGGWSNPELGPWMYINTPSDGMMDMDFVAEAPSPNINVTDAFVPVVAHALLAIPSWVKGARVHAATNFVEVLVDPPPTVSDTSFRSHDGLPVPWPFPWFNPRSKVF